MWLTCPGSRSNCPNWWIRVAKAAQNIEYKEDHEVYKFDRWLITDSFGFIHPYGMGPDGSTVVACNGRSEWRVSRRYIEVRVRVSHTCIQAQTALSSSSLRHGKCEKKGTLTAG